MKDHRFESDNIILKKRMRRRAWRKVVQVLACIAVFCTTYALILPAITMTNNQENVLTCPLHVHEHTAECYNEEKELICGEADFVVHEHEEGCYDSEGNLVCKLPEIKEHTHVPACYQENTELICELEEQSGHVHCEACYTEENVLSCDEEHEHSEECYTVERTLSCGMEEGEGAHQHDASCYETEKVLVCKEKGVLHTHTDSCYDKNGERICGETEVLEHTHGEGCYTVLETEEETVTEVIPETEEESDELSVEEVFPEEPESVLPLEGLHTAEAELVPAETSAVRAKAKAASLMALFGVSTLAAGNSTDKYDMEQYITTVNIQHRKDDNDLWSDISSGDVFAGDQLRFDILYELPANTLDPSNRAIHYQVPSNFSIIKGETGKVYDGSGTDVGDYVITTNGSITITFYRDYATKNADGAKINGHIAFESSVDDVRRNDNGDIELPFKENVTITVKDPYGDIKVVKTSSDVDSLNGTMKYRIEITSERGTNDNILLQDRAVNILGHENSLRIVNQNGQTVTPLQITNNGNDYVLPKMNAGDKYILTYDAELWPSAMNELLKGNSTYAKNEAYVYSKDTEGNTIHSNSAVTDNFSRQIITKSGEFPEGTTNKIRWTIRLNPISTSRIDLSGWRLSDDFNGAPLNPNQNVVISPNPSTGTGSITTHLPYTFPANSKVVEYLVSYETTGDSNSVNNAVLTPPGSTQGIETGDVRPGRVDLKKTGVRQELLGKNENGEPLVEETWHIELKSTGYTVLPNMVSWLFFQDPGTGVYPNGGVWQIQDNLTVSVDSYFTKEQMLENAENIAQGLIEGGYTGNYYIFFFGNSDPVAWLAKRSPGSDPYYAKAAEWQRRNFETFDPNGKYYRFWVLLDSPWGPNQTIEFDIKNMMNPGNTGATKAGSNTVLSLNADFNLSSNAVQYYTPALTKFDYRYVNNISTGVNPTEHTLEEAIDTLRWGIYVNLPSDVDYTEDVIISDTVPEGTYIYRQTIAPYFADVHVAGPSTKFGNGNADRLSYSVRNRTGTNSLLMNASNGSGTLAYGGYTMYYTLKSVRSHEEPNYLDTFELRIPKELANRIKGSRMAVFVQAYPEDYNFDVRSFTNTVTATYKGSTLDQAWQTQTVKIPAIDKNVVTNSGSEALHTDRSLPYFAAVNPTGLDLAPGSSKLSFSDTLTYSMPSGSPVNVSLNQLRVFKATDVADTEWFYTIVRNLNRSDFSYDAKVNMLNAEINEYNALIEITDSCPYTVTENVTGDTMTYTFRVSVPDGEKLLVFYDYKFTGVGKLSALTNTASIEGYGMTQQQAEHAMDLAVQDSTATAVLVGINVYKVDSRNYAVHLNGADFTLEKWNGTRWTKVQTYTTSGEGFFNTGKLDDNTAYRLTETKAPEGYEMRTATTYEFYIQNTAANAHAECKPNGFTGRALNNGDNINIENDKIVYETDLEIRKEWLDTEEHPIEKPLFDSIEVHLDQFLNNAYSATKDYTLSAENGWTLTIESLPVTDENGGKYSYRLEEVLPSLEYTDAMAVQLNGTPIDCAWNNEYGPAANPYVSDLSENGALGDPDNPLSYTVTNYAAADYTQLEVEKKWLDIEGRPMKPEDIPVDEVYFALSVFDKAGTYDKEIIAAFALTKENDWKGTITNLPAKLFNYEWLQDPTQPKYLILDYELMEIAKPESSYFAGNGGSRPVAMTIPGFVALYEGGLDSGKITVTNRTEAELTNLVVDKKWFNPDGTEMEFAPESEIEFKVIITDVESGEEFDETYTLHESENPEENWRTVVEYVPVRMIDTEGNLHTFTYRVEEIVEEIPYPFDPPETYGNGDYVPKYDAEVVIDREDSSHITLKNTNTNNFTRIIVQKKWKNEFDEDMAASVDQITVHIYQVPEIWKNNQWVPYPEDSGTDDYPPLPVNALILSEENGWTAEMPGFISRGPIDGYPGRVRFYAVEENCPAGFEVIYDHGEDNPVEQGVITLTNKEIPGIQKTTTLHINKQWLNGDGEPMENPPVDEVEILLNRNVERVDKNSVNACKAAIEIRDRSGVLSTREKWIQLNSNDNTIYFPNIFTGYLTVTAIPEDENADPVILKDNAFYYATQSISLYGPYSRVKKIIIDLVPNSPEMLEGVEYVNDDYRNNETISVTVSKEDDWSLALENLPKESDHEDYAVYYTYRFEKEQPDDRYRYVEHSYDGNVLTVTNLGDNMGSLVVDKKWIDRNGYDVTGYKTGYVEFELYRADPIYFEPKPWPGTPYNVHLQIRDKNGQTYLDRIDKVDVDGNIRGSEGRSAKLVITADGDMPYIPKIHNDTFNYDVVGKKTADGIEYILPLDIYLPNTYPQLQSYSIENWPEGVSLSCLPLVNYDNGVFSESELSYKDAVRYPDEQTTFRIYAGENHAWRTIVENLPIADENGRDYRYYIREVGDQTKIYEITNQDTVINGLQKPITITNITESGEYELPQTGGIGTRFYMVAGFLMMLASAGIFLLKKHQS